MKCYTLSPDGLNPAFQTVASSASARVLLVGGNPRQAPRVIEMSDQNPPDFAEDGTITDAFLWHKEHTHDEGLFLVMKPNPEREKNMPQYIQIMIPTEWKSIWGSPRLFYPRKDLGKDERAPAGTIVKCYPGTCILTFPKDGFPGYMISYGKNHELSCIPMTDKDAPPRRRDDRPRHGNTQRAPEKRPPPRGSRAHEDSARRETP